MNLKKEEETTLFFPAKFKINMYLRESVHFSVFTLQTIDFIVQFFISRHWVFSFNQKKRKKDLQEFTFGPKPRIMSPQFESLSLAL